VLHRFKIGHGTGRGFPLYTTKSLKAYFEPVVIKNVEYSIIDNCIVLNSERFSAEYP